jgi:hypothetical protein
MADINEQPLPLSEDEKEDLIEIDGAEPDLPSDSEEESDMEEEDSESESDDASLPEDEYGDSPEGLAKAEEDTMCSFTHVAGEMNAVPKELDLIATLRDPITATLSLFAKELVHQANQSTTFLGKRGREEDRTLFKDKVEVEKACKTVIASWLPWFRQYANKPCSTERTKTSTIQSFFNKHAPLSEGSPPRGCDNECCGQAACYYQKAFGLMTRLLPIIVAMIKTNHVWLEKLFFADKADRAECIFMVAMVANVHQLGYPLDSDAYSPLALFEGTTMKKLQWKWTRGILEHFDVHAKTWHEILKSVSVSNWKKTFIWELVLLYAQGWDPDITSMRALISKIVKQRLECIDAENGFEANGVDYDGDKQFVTGAPAIYEDVNFQSSSVRWKEVDPWKLTLWLYFYCPLLSEDPDEEDELSVCSGEGDGESCVNFAVENPEYEPKISKKTCDVSADNILVSSNGVQNGPRRSRRATHEAEHFVVDTWKSQKYCEGITIKTAEKQSELILPEDEPPFSDQDSDQGEESDNDSTVDPVELRMDFEPSIPIASPLPPCSDEDLFYESDDDGASQVVPDDVSETEAEEIVKKRKEENKKRKLETEVEKPQIQSASPPVEDKTDALQQIAKLEAELAALRAKVGVA